MYDLHTHSLLSDGALLPSEVVRHYQVKGYKAIAITDHADSSNIDIVISQLLKFTKTFSSPKFKVLPGVEITHVALKEFKTLAKFARKEGAKIIIAHGETLVEPVEEGTNRAALEADIDILAHPGLITESDVQLAKKKNIFLEVTSRKGHSLTNGHVVKSAQKIGARLIINSDSHAPEDVNNTEMLKKVALGAGITSPEFDSIVKFTRQLISSKL